MSDFLKEYIVKLLTYSENEPIIFTGLFFWGFFAIVFGVYSIIHKKITLRNTFLFLVSIFFYYKTSGLYFYLLLLTICSDYMIGHRLAVTSKLLSKRLLLGLSVTINLFILFYFKYAYFFTESYNEIFQTDYKVLNYFALFKHSLTGSGSIVDRIMLPVGISFYTFQAISYTVDIYRGKLTPLKSILDFGFYVSFFPQLVAGPIVRASEFIPQMFRKYQLSGYQFGLALFMILTGLVKKMVFGDYMAVQFIDKVFAEPISYPGFANMMAVFAYSLQVYLDFSGYTDIAIGLALLMGFRFNTNFNSPYKATNVAEFWKRWHISLSTWLKDYLYIPLGGNKKGTWGSYILAIFILCVLVMLIGNMHLFWIFGLITLAVVALCVFFPAFRKHVDTNINLMVTMLLGGFWHGSSWNFIVWGGLNGIGLVFYKYWRRFSPYEKLKGWYIRAFKIAVTFVFISFTRIWFRAPDKKTADIVKDKVLYDMDWSLADKVLMGYWKVFALFAIGMIIHWLPHTFKRQYRLYFIKSPVWVKVLVVVLTVFIIWQTLSAEFVPFIYFQF